LQINLEKAAENLPPITSLVKSAAAGMGGGRGVPPSAFDEDFLRFWEKVSLKFSPILGESEPKVFSNFRRKFVKSNKFERHLFKIFPNREKIRQIQQI